MNPETPDPAATEPLTPPLPEKSVSLLAASAILLGTVGLVLAVGLFGGYRTVWNQYDRTDRLTAELSRWSAAAATNPSDFDAQYQLGWTHFQRGNLAEALVAFKAATDLKPDHIGALYNLGLTYFEMKQFDQAVPPFKDVAERYPRHELAWLGLGRSYLELGQTENATATLLHTAGINPSSADVRFYLGLSYEKAGNNTMAFEEYQEALRFDPQYQSAAEGLKRLEGAGS